MAVVVVGYEGREEFVGARGSVIINRAKNGDNKSRSGENVDQKVTESFSVFSSSSRETIQITSDRTQNWPNGEVATASNSEGEDVATTSGSEGEE